jgi:1,4-alpha-glucan branching enzyme
MKKTGLVLISVVLFGFACALVGGCGTGRPDWESNLDERSGPEMTAEGVSFTLFAPKSSRVNLVGDFNNWSTTADPLFDREGTGVWTLTIPLAPGRYEYKFYVDGEKWIPDPGNPERTDDGFGGWNSVITVPRP